LPDLFTLKQVADRLQLSERTLYRLLQRGELPGRKVGGQWRFRLSEIDYWLDMRLGRMRSVDLQGLEGAGAGAGPAVSLGQGLRPENALIEVPAGTRREMVTAFVAAVTYPQPVDGSILAARVWEREELSSTGTVDGVAFLHTARWESRAVLKSPVVALGRLPSPVDFGAIDGTPTDLLFLLLAPDDRTHLTLLAKAARLCRDPQLLRDLRAARTGREVVRLVQASEHAVFRPDSDSET
jgi:PTS system nitrogen regulatory IIA component